MDKTILALGSDIKNRFLISDGQNISFGPDTGDLGDANNYEFFKTEVYQVIKRSKPNIVIHDLHPGYFSTRFAKTCNLQPATCNLQPVQHHHAHIASVMFEHGLKGPVIGVSFDGTGYGTDGNIWGGEFLVVDKAGFKRAAHFTYREMPGGEKCIKEPWRMALSIIGEKAAPFIKRVSKKEKRSVLEMLKKRINCPLTSSAGRIFDAAAATLGLCVRASFEAEAPLKLEKLCERSELGSYKFNIKKQKNSYEIDVRPLFNAMLRDIKKKKKKSIIATNFHNSMANIILDTVKKISGDTNIKTVALSGGVFQNKFLKMRAIKILSLSEFRVFINEKNPVNDLNISLGQYYVSCSTGKN
ncbi:MAG: carbamoyltransferase HypF [Candidatus Omnitrophica bacterium]|nr:carbamoyltransferase HypF [Candidatus Omnitrophota bacterium]